MAKKTIFKEGSEIEYCQLYWVHRFQPCHNQICYQIQRIIFRGKIGSTLSVVLGAPPEEEKWIGKSLKTGVSRIFCTETPHDFVFCTAQT